jgi:hypothetical protein
VLPAAEIEGRIRVELKRLACQSVEGFVHRVSPMLRFQMHCRKIQAMTTQAAVPRSCQNR